MMSGKASPSREARPGAPTRLFDLGGKFLASTKHKPIHLNPHQGPLVQTQSRQGGQKGQPQFQTMPAWAAPNTAFSCHLSMGQAQRRKGHPAILVVAILWRDAHVPSGEVSSIIRHHGGVGAGVDPQISSLRWKSGVFTLKVARASQGRRKDGWTGQQPPHPVSQSLTH